MRDRGKGPPGRDSVGKWKRGSKEVGGHLRLPVEEAANGLGPAKSAPDVMEAKAYGWRQSHLVPHVSHTRWLLRPGMFWNKVPGLTPDFRFVIDSTPDPHLGDLMTRGGGQNSPSGGISSLEVFSALPGRKQAVFRGEIKN